MLYFSFDDIRVPLSCITGFSYTKSGNIVNTSRLTCKCIGIMPMQVQVQMTLSNATCMDGDFIKLAQAIAIKKPSNTDSPSNIIIGDDIIIPQLKFMLISTNITYQSDRLGKLQEMEVSWTLAGSRVVKDENRDIELKASNDDQLPAVTLHCKGKSIECSQDINIADLRLSGFKGTIQLVLADTYTKVDRDAWLATVNDAEDSYFEIEGYGKFCILESTVIADNWIDFSITKFSKEWYRKHVETFMMGDKPLTLANIFNDVTVKSNAEFEYFKFDDLPINVLYNLQDSLGYLIGLRDDQIYLYDAPDSINSGQVTYDYVLDNDLMTVPITKVIIRDGYGEYSAGDDKGETFFVNALCRVTSDAAENVLKYAQFNQNMITLTIPFEKRIAIGSIINVNVGDKVINCVCTEYDIDFLSNQMQLELHYVDR